MSKSLISKELSILRNYGFKVFNFNLNKSLPAGLKNFCDHIIISESHLIFIEVKIGRDTLNTEQSKLQGIIHYLSINNKSIHYVLITNLKEAKEFAVCLLSNNIIKYRNKELN